MFACLLTSISIHFRNFLLKTLFKFYIYFIIIFFLNRDFYELKDFPIQCLLTRCSVGKKKNIYFTSPSVKDIVKNNQDRVKVCDIVIIYLIEMKCCIWSFSKNLNLCYKHMLYMLYV